MLLATAWSLLSCSYYDPTQLSTVEVSENADTISILPKSGSHSSNALLFYPGGFVPASGYVRLLSRFSENGYRVLIIKMPLDLAALDPEKGARFTANHQDVKKWVVAGHSLGGAMAATLIRKKPGLISGAVFLAAYPAEADDLSKETMPMLSLSASLDGLATPEKINSTKKYLPPSTEFVSIAGGNHAQFGSYGKQNGDGTATISEESQHLQVVAKLTNFFQTKI